MTSEALYPVSETYEALRDSVENTEARAAWNDADRRRANLSETYRNLRDDPRYTDEHKAHQMWKAYEAQSEVIQAAAEKAREELEKDAKGHEAMSMPRPKGENLTASTPERLLIAQNEAARIVRKVERIQGSAGPFKQSAGDVLRTEYAKGIEVGGVEGVAICQGALRAADELGISAEEFLSSLRTTEQLEALDKARRCRTMAQSIGKSIPEPPLRRPVDNTPGPGKLFIPRNRPIQTKRQAPSWMR